MAGGERLDVPAASGAVPPKGSDTGRDEIRQMDETPIVVHVPGYEPRRCLVCRQPLAPGERKLHRGRCARARETELQKVRRRRKRVPRHGIVR